MKHRASKLRQKATAIQENLNQCIDISILYYDSITIKDDTEHC
jgi:hypothetical protein